MAVLQYLRRLPYEVRPSLGVRCVSACKKKRKLIKRRIVASFVEVEDIANATFLLTSSMGKNYTNH